MQMCREKENIRSWITFGGREVSKITRKTVLKYLSCFTNFRIKLFIACETYKKMWFSKDLLQRLNVFSTVILDIDHCLRYIYYTYVSGISSVPNFRCLETQPMPLYWK
jgi:hypothetical protein